MKKRAACYCRVSTRKGEQLESLEKQRAFFARFFMENPEYELYHLYADEGISAKSMRNRKQFVQMLDDAQSGCFDAVFVKDVSRFARNVQDFYYALTLLEERDIRVHFVTLNLKSEPASRFTLGLMALLAEDESQRLSVKVKFGKEVTARRGRVPNFVFGYDRLDTYTLRPHPQEAEWVRRIFSMYVEEGVGAARIAQTLNDARVPTKRGNVGSWTQSVITKLLRNRLYIGEVVNLRSEVRDFKTGTRIQHPGDHWVTAERPEFAIVEREVFHRAQALLEERGQARRGRRQSSKHPLSNLLLCDEDGRSMRRVARGERVYWTCSVRNAMGVDACKNDWRIDEKSMHVILLDLFHQALSAQPNGSARLAAMAKAQLRGRKDSGEDNEQKIQALEARKRRLRDLYADGLISRQEAAEGIEPINRQLDELRRERKCVEPCMNLEDMARIYMDSPGDKAKWLDNAFLKQFVARIEVKTDGTIALVLRSGKRARIAQAMRT